MVILSHDSSVPNTMTEGTRYFITELGHWMQDWGSIPGTYVHVQKGYAVLHNALSVGFFTDFSSCNVAQTSTCKFFDVGPDSGN